MKLKIFLFVIIAVLIILSFYIRLSWLNKGACEDSYIDLWQEPNKILQGINPYERILSGNMIHNKKYPQMLPLAYLLPALFIKLGVSEPDANIKIFRIIMLMVDLLIGIFIFKQGVRHNNTILGMLCGVLWLLNRWTLKMNYDVKPDNISMLFAVMSLFFLECHPVEACLLLGVSLSFKHISIFLFPVFLLYKLENFKQLGTRVFFIFLSPLIVSLPFMIWNFEGFLKSILFALTRLQKGDFYLSYIFRSYGFLSRVPMLAMLLLLYTLLVIYRDKFNIYLFSFLGFLIYASFTPLLFDLYFLWNIPFGLMFILQKD